MLCFLKQKSSGITETMKCIHSYQFYRVAFNQYLNTQCQQTSFLSDTTMFVTLRHIHFEKHRKIHCNYVLMVSSNSNCVRNIHPNCTDNLSKLHRFCTHAAPTTLQNYYQTTLTGLPNNMLTIVHQ